MKILLAVCIALFSHISFANSFVAKELSGRWYTPDRQYSNIWRLYNINIGEDGRGSALIEFWSTQSLCSMHGEHIVLQFDGATLVGQVQFTKRRLCPTRFEITLKKSGDGQWAGKLEADISSRYPYVETKVK